MVESNPVLQAIAARRSVAPRRLVPPGPDREQLKLMILAAVAAPDHGRLRPWRFIVIEAGQRAALAAAFAAAARELDPGAAEAAVSREAEKAEHGPCLIAVIARIDPAHAIAPPHEQWASVGAAIQNLLLAAESLGFAAMIVSGRKVGTQALRRAFSLADAEHLVGFVAVGSYEGPAAGSDHRPVPEERLEDWTPPAG